jgi:sugar phosphate isomerase/epimerase
MNQTPFNRRDFLKSTGATGIALLSAAQQSAAAPSTGMFLALSSALTGTKVQWPEFARLAARLGYGGADLNLNAAMKEGVDATRSLYTDLKIRGSFCSLPVNTTGTQELFDRGMTTLDDAAKFIAAVGCPRMMMVLPTSSTTPADELRKMLSERLTTVAKVLAAHNVRLGLEFLGPLMFRTRAPHEFIWRMGDAVDFAKEIGPNIGVVLDAWHWHHSGATTDDIIKAGKSRIVTIHLSDAAKQAPEDVKDNQRLFPGEGVINLVGFFQALKQIGYEDGVSPEVIGRVPAEMSAEEGAKLALDASLAVMRKAGIAI